MQTQTRPAYTSVNIDRRMVRVFHREIPVICLLPFCWHLNNSVRILNVFICRIIETLRLNQRINFK